MQILIQITSIIIFLVLIYLLIIPFIKGAPFFPTEKDVIKRMIQISDVKVGEKIVDLGSGDGRILIEFAKKGAVAYGYEISPVLVLLSKLRIRKNKLNEKIFVFWKDFWSVDFSQFDIIVVFGRQAIMSSLSKKLKSELKSGARVISYAFPFPQWEYVKEDKGVYLYQV